MRLIAYNSAVQNVMEDLLDILIDVLIPDHVINVVFVVTMALLFVGILLVAVGTVTKNGWGINLDPVNCPACDSPMPQVRQPKTLRQALGWRHLRKKWLRDGQMGPHDYANPLAVEISPSLVDGAASQARDTAMLAI